MLGILKWLDPWSRTENAARNITRNAVDEFQQVRDDTLHSVEAMLAKYSTLIDQRLQALLRQFAIIMAILIVAFLVGLYIVLSMAT